MLWFSNVFLALEVFLLVKAYLKVKKGRKNCSARGRIEVRSRGCLGTGDQHLTYYTISLRWPSGKPQVCLKHRSETAIYRVGGETGRQIEKSGNLKMWDTLEKSKCTHRSSLEGMTIVSFTTNKLDISKNKICKWLNSPLTTCKSKFTLHKSC